MQVMFWVYNFLEHFLVITSHRESKRSRPDLLNALNTLNILR